SSRRIRGCATGSWWPRRASSRTSRGGAADGATAPARRLPGRPRRQWTRRPADQLLAVAPRREARGHLRRRERGRHVPPLAVLPATALVDKAVRAVRARLAGVRALRLEQPARTRPEAVRSDDRDHGRHLVLPLAARDGAQPRDVRRSRQP